VAEEALTNFLKKSPGNEEVLLALAQLYETQQNHEKAVEVLSKLDIKIRARPKTLQAMVALHEKKKDTAKAVGCFREAIEYWVKQGDEHEDDLAAVLQIATKLDIHDRASWRKSSGCTSKR